jgi:hypothetical protein
MRNVSYGMIERAILLGKASLVNCYGIGDIALGCVGGC